MPVPFISIVSEETESLQPMAEGLEKLGFPVRSYLSLKSALETAFGAPPSLMIFDLPLDSSQIGKLLAFLRQHQKMRDIPVVIITEENRCQALRQNPSRILECVSRPLILGELAARVKDLLARTNNQALLQRSLQPGAAADVESLVVGGSGKPFVSSLANIGSTGSPASPPQPEPPKAASTPDPATGAVPAAAPGQSDSASPSGSESPSGSIPAPVEDSAPAPQHDSTHLTAAVQPESAEGSSQAHEIAQPVIYDVDPPQVECGEEGIEISVNGENFLSSYEAAEIHGREAASGSAVYFEGRPVPTLFYSSSQLKAHIPQFLLAHNKRGRIQVGNPDLGGHLSEAFEIGIANPLPRLHSVHPDVLTSAMTDPVLTLRGSSFVPDSLVYLGDELVRPEYHGPKELLIHLSGEVVVKPGPIPVQVYNPDPGGGVSQIVVLQFETAQPRIEGTEPTSIRALGRAIPPAQTGDAEPLRLTVTGRDFVEESIVYFDGVQVETQFASSRELLAVIPAVLLREAGSYSVTVVYQGEKGLKLTNHGVFVVRPPLPWVRGVHPEVLTAGDEGVELTIQGLYFRSGCIVHAGSHALPPTSVSAEELRVPVPDQLVSVSGEFALRIESPAPSQGLSNETIVRVLNAAPALDSISPDRLIAGTGDVQLELRGDHFMNHSQVLFDDAQLPVVFESRTCIQAAIPAELLEHADQHVLTVRNPEPGGGDSMGLRLSVVNPQPEVRAAEPDGLDCSIRDEVEVLLAGDRFVPLSVAYCNDEPCSTTFIDGGHVALVLPARFLGTSRRLRLKVGNPAPGGGVSEDLPFDIRNPRPLAERLDPPSLEAGWKFQSFRVRGHNFNEHTRVRFDGQVTSARVVDDTTLTLDLGPRELTHAGNHVLVVSNPAPGGGDSDPLMLVLSHPRPEISYVLPAGCEAGGSPPQLAINGMHFATGAIVRINGEERMTQHQQSNQLATQLQKKDLRAGGELEIQVVSPEPGGCLSAPFRLTVYNPVPALDSIEVEESEEGQPHLVITIQGRNFNEASRVYLGQQEVECTSETPTRILARVPRSMLQGEEMLSLAVENPGPGGGRTNGASLMVDRCVPAADSGEQSYTLDDRPQQPEIVVLDFVNE